MAGTDVLLARLGGRVVAFSATCPHQRTDLEGASFVDGGIRCPQHAYLYDLGTGENLAPARTADPAELPKLRPGYLPLYPVEERDGWIWVGPEALPPPPAHDPARERPPPPRAGEPVAQPTEALRVVAGATFELRLPTTPVPGCSWRVEAGPLLTVVEQRLEAVDPPRHLVRVVAGHEGAAALRCTYARPWDAEPLEVRTYEVLVEPARPPGYS